MVRLKRHQKLPYLFAGVFIATSASLPIGVSNIANLNTLSLLLYFVFKKEIPKKIATFNDSSIEFLILNQTHPLSGKLQTPEMINWSLFKIFIVVVLIRGSYFVLPTYGVPIEGIAITGAVILVVIRWISLKVGILDIKWLIPYLSKTPYQIKADQSKMIPGESFAHTFVDQLKTFTGKIVIFGFGKDPQNMGLLKSWK